MWSTPFLLSIHLFATLLLMARPRFHRLRVSDVRRETPNCVSVAFEVPAELRTTFAYVAGQYLTLRTALDGEELRRSYSLCSAPHEQEWRVAIKAVPGGRFSTLANERLQVGDTLEVMPPAGSFHAPEEPVRQIVCFAAGSGITPIISILKQVLHESTTAEAVLIYGNRSTGEVILREEIEALKNLYMRRFRVYHVLSREDHGIDLLCGRIDAARVEAFAKTFFRPAAVDHFYFCGPEPMIRAGSEVLMRLGVDKSKIHFELFGAPLPQASLAGAAAAPVAMQRRVDQSRIAITVDQKTVIIDMIDDGSHLLEAGLSFGLDLPFACKGGVCSTCKCMVTKGEVAMDLNYALEPDEVEAGFVLSCQSRPMSAEVAVTFDV